MIGRADLLVLVIGCAGFAGCSGSAGSRRRSVSDHQTPAIVAPVPGPGIRAIDWMNRTYVQGDARYTVAGGQVETELADDLHGFFSVTPPVFGDLTGDGAEEVVIITLEHLGGTGMFTSVDVYGMVEGAEAVIGTIPGGDRGDGGIADVQIDGNAVAVDRYLSLEGDGACCPSQLQHERWTWDGTTFVENEAARTVTEHAAG